MTILWATAKEQLLKRWRIVQFHSTCLQLSCGYFVQPWFRFQLIEPHLSWKSITITKWVWIFLSLYVDIDSDWYRTVLLWLPHSTLIYISTYWATLNLKEYGYFSLSMHTLIVINIIQRSKPFLSARYGASCVSFNRATSQNINFSLSVKLWKYSNLVKFRF